MESDDDADGHDRRTPGTASDDAETVVAAERLLRSLHEHGVTRLFANLGTDHAPLLEAAARLDAADRTAAYPEIVVCPHEFAAMSAAHGYTAATGEPQAVLVHVDVGTQNLGAAMHNAHRSRVPMVVLAGLAPITDEGFEVEPADRNEGEEEEEIPGKEFGEGYLMWRCTECGEMGELEDGMPDSCPNCGAPEEALTAARED